MADDIITSVVAGLLIAAISAIAAGLWHQLKNLQRYPECAHCAPAGRKAIMSITINGVKPGTATLTIRAGPQSVDAPVTVREHL